MVLFLLRLLIKPREAYFDPIYKLIYRITEPLLIPSRYFTSHPIKGILLSLLTLVVLRGVVYISIKPMSLMSGLGVSLLDLFQLLFKGYMVILIVTLLSRQGFGTSFMNITQQAFLPLFLVSDRLKIPRRHFYLFSFTFLWILYALFSFSIHYIMLAKSVYTSFSVLYGLGEGLILMLSLFPGFFSLVIIVGALLSWVSPDPYNPLVQAIYGISEPLLAPFRRLIPHLGGIDFSPILALLCFQILGGLSQRMVAGLMGLI